MKLSLKGYDHLTRELILMAETFCGGKIVFVLEGGNHTVYRNLANGQASTIPRHRKIKKHLGPKDLR